ncbi:MAG: preprotein translocase subunit SecE [Patescibacteria group bacterium]
MKNNRLTRYFVDSWGELKKVKWPSRTEVINNTVIVILAVVTATATTAAVDYGLAQVVEYLVERG